MEFPFDCEKALDCQANKYSNNDGIVVLESAKFSNLTHPMLTTQLSYKQKNLADILDRMGEASSKVSPSAVLLRIRNSLV